MPDPNQTSEPSPQQNPDAASETLARRRALIKGAATIGPVVLTLASRPVLGGGGGGGQCIAPSQNLSGALSHAAQKMGTCNGHPPSYWKNCAGQNGSWPLQPTTQFHSLCTPGNRAGTRFYTTNGVSLTMIDVLKLTGSGPSGNFDLDQVASHIIAACLNIRSGTVDQRALTEAQLQAIWREWALTGQYIPFAGATPWKSAEIKNYLIANKIVGI
ncbi:hypothetical protein [Niveibacterium sp. SC-1]|uniref:hypothetical protein n=1 Tax=Niveibacterium sp. SC-1 TaxID=3135646 RepID=UPI0031203F3B